MGCHYGCVSHYEHQSVESAVDCVDEPLKLLRLLVARLLSGAAHLEPWHREQRQGRRDVPKDPIEIDHAITPSMKLALPSQAGAFAPPSVPAGHLRTVAGTPSEVDLRRLSSIALNSRRWLAGGKHLPITFRASPTPSERLPSTFRIRGDASRRGQESPLERSRRERRAKN